MVLCVCACMHACVRACMHACVRACVRVSVCVAYPLADASLTTYVGREAFVAALKW